MISILGYALATPDDVRYRYSRNRITTTDYQHIAHTGNQFVRLRELHTGEDTVLLRKKFQGKINALQLSSRNLQVACRWRTGRYHIGIEAFWQFSYIYLLIVSELDALLFEDEDGGR